MRPTRCWPRWATTSSPTVRASPSRAVASWWSARTSSSAPSEAAAECAWIDAPVVFDFDQPLQHRLQHLAPQDAVQDRAGCDEFVAPEVLGHVRRLPPELLHDVLVPLGTRLGRQI